MTYQEALDNIGRTTERTLLRLFAQFEAGEITERQFISLGATTIGVAQQQGRYMAEVSFLAWLRTIEPEAMPVAAPVLSHYQDVRRLEKAVSTITAATTAMDVPDRLGRLAYAETVEASQRSFQEAMARSGVAKGWIRGLEPGACQLCQWWSRDGQVWPINHTMPTHKGCTCTPVPTTGAA